MVWKRIASGDGVASLRDLPQYEESIAEGQRQKLSLSLRTAVSPSVLEALQSRLEQAGVAEARVEGTGAGMDITFRKGFPFLAVVVAAVLGLIVLAILIVGWQFFKEAAEVLPQPVMIVGVIVGIVLLAVIAFAVWRRA